MPKKSYSALIFRQRDGAPVQVAFAAPSSEIDAWARVPTKRTGNIRNFQRAQIPTHVKEVEQFFLNSANASPTAVVVGFDPIRAFGKARTVDKEGHPIVEQTLKGGSFSEGAIEIEWPDDGDPQSITALQKALIHNRPSLQDVIFRELEDITGMKQEKLNEIAADLALLSPAALENGGPSAEVDTAVVSEDATGEDLEPTPELEIPEEIRLKLAGLSPSEQQVVTGRLSFLAQFSDSALKGKSQEYLDALHREAVDELKPGILIDGQHRILGTKKLGNIPFLVTALPGAAWPELAFHFIVTNRTARRVPESLLISIVGNSLSKTQRSQIEERLRQANIRVGLIEAVMRIHEDEQSPFFGMLAFGLKNEEGFIDAAAMRSKVIKLWYERRPPVDTLFDHLCKGKRKFDRTEYWKSEELWLEYFIAFWSAVRERYDGSNVFSVELIDKTKKTPASRLMTATVLMIFQETILEHLRHLFVQKENTEGVPIAESIPNEVKFRELVRNTLTRLTPDFFTEWQLSGFDGSKGARDDLADAISKVITEKTVAQLKNPKNPHRLFRKMSAQG